MKTVLKNETSQYGNAGFAAITSACGRLMVALPV